MKNRELHLHLDGSLRINTVYELLKEQKIEENVKNIKDLENRMRVPENCEGLVEYLKRFQLPLKVLQDPQSIERVSYELVEDLSKQGMQYSEIRFAPQLSTLNGCSQLEITKAAISGIQKAEKDLKNIKCGLILCMMRNKDNYELNTETINVTEKLLGDTVCAIDLAGAESLYPTKMFIPLYNQAKERKIPMTIHAGEVEDKESLEDAINLGVKRIGHGILSSRYPDIISKLIDNDITLEVCVTSNYHTKALGMNKVSEHPIKYLFDKGVKIALSTDNSTASNTNLENEFKLIKQIFNFNDKDLDKIREYSKQASFLK